MRAVVLAAGSGSRLAPYTDDRPKALVEVRGRAMINYAIGNFLARGIRDICVVTGYHREAFHLAPHLPIRYFHNPRFAETNMLASLFCAESALEGDVVVSYGDIVYEPRVLKKLMEDPGDISVVVDDGWLDQWKLRNDDPLKDAETLRLNAQNRIIEIGDKPRSYDEIQSQYIGLIKFSPAGLELLKSEYHRLEKLDPAKPILRGRAFPKLFFTDMLQILADRHPGSVNGVRIDRGWFEVDTVRDYEVFNARLPARNDFCDLTAIPAA